MYIIMVLKYPSDDIAPDVDYARALLHQVPMIVPTWGTSQRMSNKP